MKKDSMIKRNIIIYGIMLILLMASILPRELNDLDELWNYNFARNIYDGKLPYKDFNMLQMPLLPIICGTILKIFGNELIVMRAIGIFLNATILFGVYKILEQLKINKHYIYASLGVIYILYFNYFRIDYNFAVLLIILLSIYIELKHLNKNNDIFENYKTKEILLGILVGTSILFKQTTGIFLSIIFIFYKLLLVAKKQELKLVIPIICRRLVGVCIPIIILCIYLTLNNIWYEFLDYAIWGIKTFDNVILYNKLIKFNVLGILSILVPITMLYMYFKVIIKKVNTEEQKNIFILFVYSIASFIVIFPISGATHFLIGSMPTIIAIIYISWLRLKDIKISNKIKMIYKILSEYFIWVLVTCATCFIILHFMKYDSFSNKNHYKYITSKLDDNITQIDNYIIEQNNNGKKVYILDAVACLYMIPLDKYNKNYDMFLKGNLGAKGEIGQIENLEEEEDIVVLIMNDNYNRNWQNPEKVRKYIINNWNKKGEIEQFDIYEKE